MKNDQILIEREDVKRTVVDLNYSKMILEREIKTLTERVEGIVGRIQSLEQKLAKSASDENGNSVRLRKGEGLTAILGVLNGPAGLGMTSAKISEQTGISPSTVSRILDKHKDQLLLGADMMWRKKTE